MLYTSVLDRMERSWIMYGRVRRKMPDKRKDHQGRKGDVISCLYVHPECVTDLLTNSQWRWISRWIMLLSRRESGSA